MRDPEISFVPDRAGMIIQIRSDRKGTLKLKTEGNASLTGKSRNGDLRFEETSWNENRRWTFKKSTREWITRSPAKAGSNLFKFEAEVMGDTRLPTLIHYSKPSVVRRLRRPKLIVHFHGGPESTEFGEKRFGNTFPELVSEGNAYAGWNYPGSIGFGKAWTELPRGNWERAIITEWKNVERALTKRYSIPKKDWVLVGPSFGAMVALLIARSHPAIGKLVLVSPLLSLRNQIERVRRADPSQLGWFRKRFGEIDLDRLDFSSSLHEVSARISVIASGRDEVLGTNALNSVIRSARAYRKRIDFHVQRGCAHSPRTAPCRRKRERLLRSAILN